MTTADHPMCYPASGALPPASLVSLNERGQLVFAGCRSDQVFYMPDRARVAGEVMQVLRLPPASARAITAIAGGRIERFADVYLSNAGRVSSSPIGRLIGLALDEAEIDQSVSVLCFEAARLRAITSGISEIGERFSAIA